jgi:acetoacetyl-CoA synthetase
MDPELVSMTEILVRIWSRVLQRPKVGLADNFFDLGGDSASAGAIFAEIAQVSGHELPPEAILQSPTIANLAALLEGTSSLRIPRIIQLRGGAKVPAVFMTHGVGGSLLDLLQLVHNIQTDQPIYGLQARGLDGVDEPHDRLEDTAQYFLDAIREKQQHGPYNLIGFSLGGLIMLDVAQRLSVAGEEIASLMMIDSYLGARFQPFGQRMGIYSRKIKKHAWNMRQLPLRDAVSYIFRRLERRKQMFRRANRNSAGHPIPFAQLAARVKAAGYQALNHYRPHFYPGKVRFLQAEISSDFPDNARAVWSNLVGDITVEIVPGDHLGIISSHAEGVGAVVSSYLQEATCQKEVLLVRDQTARSRPQLRALG